MSKKILVLAVAISLAAVGCSLLESPDVEEHGVIVLRLSGGGSAAAPMDDALARALPTADSVVVKVYRPGTGSQPEATKGVALNPPAGTAQVQLTVIAEAGKRVAVELFQAGLMTFFGVDEAVDVLRDQNTSVSIVARSFVLPAFWRDISVVDEGTTFNLMWNRTPGAGFYRFQESPVPDFSVISFEAGLTDTFTQVNGGDLPGGDYYFRVAAENIYTQSEFAEQYVHIYAAPAISGISAPEAMRSQVVQLTVFGEHLDYPGTQVWIFGRAASIVTAATDQLLVQVQVPLKGTSDVVMVDNALGTAWSADYVRVQNIAYITDVQGQGDTAAAALFEQEIESYWETTGQAAVRVLPKDFAVSPVLFDVVVIGWDAAQDVTGWQGAYQPQTDAIAQSGTMVLGIGAGGASYFENIGLTLGFGGAQTSFQSGLYVVDPADDVYNLPNPLNATAGSLLGVYTRNLEMLSVPFSGNNNVTPFAARAPLMLLHPLVEETTTVVLGTATNLLWGFNGVEVSPDNLTQDGAWLLENVVVYLLGKTAGGVVVPAAHR
ncbi:MAG: hypothetical protein ACE5EO_00370 [Candidatus Krumholzibacteriia bacterium]